VKVDFWFPPVTVPVGFGQERGATRLPVLTMVSGYSRWLSAVLVPSRHGQDLFAGWLQLISRLGVVPRALVWDGEGAIGRWRAGKPGLTAECQAFRGTLGTKVVVCRPADPEAKGLVERANGYLETSFLPGRRFASPEDFNEQLAEWCATVNGRIRRALGCAPADRIAADRQAMLTLPPVAPETGWRASVRLPRDHYLRLDANDYSANPRTSRPPLTDHSHPLRTAHRRPRAARRPAAVTRRARCAGRELPEVPIELHGTRGQREVGFPSQRGEILLRERSFPMGESRRKCRW
jgi:hypothetical protein